MSAWPDAAITLPGVRSSQTGDAGVALVQLRTNMHRSSGGLGFVFRPQLNVDVGIDGHVETVTQPHDQATGRFFGVQVKTTENGASVAGRDSWNVYIAKTTMEYWRRYSVPVILVFVDLQAQAAFWSRVDQGEFEETAQSIVVPISRERVYDANSGQTLANIAQNAPPSLYSRIELPQSLALEARSLGLALASSHNTERWLSVAERGLSLFARMRSAGFVSEATTVARNAVRAFLHAGQQSSAYTTLVALLRVVLSELRNPDRAYSLKLSAVIPPTEAGWPSPTNPASPSQLLDLEYVEAEIAALQGDVSLATALLERPANVLEGRSAYTVAGVRSAKLAALVAVATENHVHAMQEYEKLAHLTNDETESLAFTLKQHLHAGMHENPQGHITAVASLAVPQQLNAERLFVLGWLQSRVSTADAAKTFEDAAEAALALTNSYAAMRAYRNAAWGFARSPQGINTGVSSALAKKLEPIVSISSPHRMTHDILMRQVDYYVAHADLRQAFFASRSACIAAWLDSDPAALEESVIRHGSVCRAAAQSAPERATILPAVSITAATRAHFSSAEEANIALAEFRTLLRARLLPAFASEVWHSLALAANSEEEIVGALTFATDFAREWEFEDRDKLICELVIRGLKLGWNAQALFNGARASCDLILSLDPAFGAMESARLRDALPPLIASSPHIYLSLALNAFAVTIAHGSSPLDEGNSLRLFLFSIEDVANSANAAPEWFGAVAMLFSVAEGRCKATLGDFLLARATTATLKSRIGWYAAERALAAGLDLDPAIAERYLLEMTELLRALRAQIDSGSLGAGAGDIQELTEWASRVASKEVRENAFNNAIGFLKTQEHLLFERVRWLFFIARLARRDSMFIKDAVTVLSAVARGELRPQGRLDDYRNPYATFQIHGHTSANVISDAMHSLVAILPAAQPKNRDLIMEVLQEGISNADPTIRSAVVEATRWLSTRESIDADLRGVIAARVLDPLSNDQVDAISVAALRTLRTLTNSAQERGDQI